MAQGVAWGRRVTCRRRYVSRVCTSAPQGLRACFRAREEGHMGTRAALRSFAVGAQRQAPPRQHASPIRTQDTQRKKTSQALGDVTPTAWALGSQHQGGRVPRGCFHRRGGALENKRTHIAILAAVVLVLGRGCRSSCLVHSVAARYYSTHSTISTPARGDASSSESGSGDAGALPAVVDAEPGLNLRWPTCTTTRRVRRG